MTCLTSTTPHSLGFILISLVITSQFLLLIFSHLPPTFCALASSMHSEWQFPLAPPLGGSVAVFLVRYLPYEWETS